MYLSKDFKLSEFVASRTALRRGIRNIPDSAVVVDNLRDLVVEVLQPCRDELGVPLRVLSGYRSPRLNRAVGGARRSDHLWGFAADVETVPYDRSLMLQLGLFVERVCCFKQLIWEFGGAWVHVSYRRDDSRREVLEAYHRRGWRRRVTYRPFTFADLST